MLTKICNEIIIYNNDIVIIKESVFKYYIEQLLINIIADLNPQTEIYKIMEIVKKDLQDLFDLLDKKIVVLFNNNTYKEFYNASDVIDSMMEFISVRINILKKYSMFINRIKE